MKAKDDLSELKAGAGIFAVIAALVLVLAVTALFVSSPAAAGHGDFRSPGVSDALEANNLATLRFALDTTGLPPVLDSNNSLWQWQSGHDSRWGTVFMPGTAAPAVCRLG